MMIGGRAEGATRRERQCVNVNGWMSGAEVNRREKDVEKRIERNESRQTNPMDSMRQKLETLNEKWTNHTHQMRPLLAFWSEELIDEVFTSRCVCVCVRLSALPLWQNWHEF